LTDKLAVILIKPTGSPEAILIIWPLKPTDVEPAKLQTTVAAIVKSFVHCPDRVRRPARPRSMTPKTAPRESDRGR
jgi:hypothetical protein